MKGIIVDTDKKFISNLISLCDTIDRIKIVNVFDNKLEAAAFLQENKIDFMVIDVDLPLADSLDIFKSLNKPPQTIIATKNPHFALKAYECSFVLDYVLKPLCLDRYGRSFLRLAERLADKNTEPGINPNKLFIAIDKRLTGININDILFIEAKGDYITIHTEQGKYTTYASLKKVYARLKNNQFVNIHRSFIVNIDKIVDLDQNTVIIGKQILPISRYKRNYLMDQLNAL
jgi:DNA-binding LytR/AlgR family response regulator